MASGDVVGHILNIMPPATLNATPDTRTGGSTPAESVPVWDFDAATDEMLDYYGVLHGYGSGGLTVSLKWMASTATTGNVVWQIGIRRLDDDVEDVDAAHTYDYNNGGQDLAPSASGELSYDDVTFTNGADMDSLANNEAFILRIRRDADSTAATDDMAGDAELIGLTIRET